jgi:hypothetical protein
VTERFTRADVARILASINEAASSLRLDGAGSWVVEDRGGKFLYLDDRSGMADDDTRRGALIEELGKGWHSAYLRLHTLRRDLLTVQIRQGREG